MKCESMLEGRNSAVLCAAPIVLPIMVVALLIICMARLHAAELDYVKVEREGSRFTIDFRMKLSVPVDQLRVYLTDVEQLARVSPTTIESEMITFPGSNQPLLRIVLKPCVLIFCKRLIKVSHIHEQSDPQNFSRRYVVEPSVSNFREATETLDLAPDGNDTLFRYRAELEPDFYVPSLIASWLIRRTLVEDLLITAATVEDEFLADTR